MFRTAVVAMAKGKNISISLEHMKVASRVSPQQLIDWTELNAARLIWSDSPSHFALQMDKRFGNTVCVDETQKVMDALHAADYYIQPIYKYVKAVDDCVEKLREERSKPKATTLYHLSKYVNQRKHKTK